MNPQEKFVRQLEEAIGDPYRQRGYPRYGGHYPRYGGYYPRYGGYAEQTTKLAVDTKLNVIRFASSADKSISGIMKMLGNPVGKAPPELKEFYDIDENMIAEEAVTAAKIEIHAQDPESGANIYKLSIPLEDGTTAERYVVRRIEIGLGETFAAATERVRKEITDRIDLYIRVMKNFKEKGQTAELDKAKKKFLDEYSSKVNAERDLSLISAETKAAGTMAGIREETVEKWAKAHGIPNRDDIVNLFGITSSNSLYLFARRFIQDVANQIPRWAELEGSPWNNSDLENAIGRVAVKHRIVDFIMKAYSVPNKITEYAAQALAALTIVGSAAILCADEKYREEVVY